MLFFQLDYVAGPELNTPILQLGARFAVDLQLVTLVFALGHVQNVVRFLKSGWLKNALAAR